MARPMRIEYPGALYHITSRGNARKKIYLSNADRKNFLSILKEVMQKYNWLCYAYCLMPNHYHLLIETPDANLSIGMRHLNGVYTQRFNKNNKRVGHVFQGRFKSIVVEKDNYLLELVRYIALNPVRAKIVHFPEEWVWSSYQEMMGKSDKSERVLSDSILLYFGQTLPEARKQYRKFVLAGVDQESPWVSLKGGILLGREEFVERMGEYSKGMEKVKEIPKKERYVHRPSLKEIFSNIACVSGRIDRNGRNKMIHKAYVEHGYTLAEIGKFLGVHYSTASKALKTLLDH